MDEDTHVYCTNCKWFRIDDIGHSSNVICFGCDLTLRETKG